MPSDHGPVCVFRSALPASEPIAEPAPAEPRPPAPAARPALMGQQGQWVIDSSLSLVLAHAWGGGGSGTSLSLAPVAHYFLVENVALSFGVVAGLTPTEREDIALLGAGLGGRGYVPILPSIGLWPGLLVSLARISVGGREAGALTIQVGVPVLFHVAPPFFVGVAPELWMLAPIGRGGDVAFNARVGFLMGAYL